MPVHERKFGPPVGSEIYEGFRSQFVPAFDPLPNDLLAQHFVAPLPVDSFNLPAVAPVEAAWQEGVQVPTELQERAMGFVTRFYQRATAHGVVDDIARVDLFQFTRIQEDFESHTYVSFGYEAAVRTGTEFVNEFERHIFLYKVRQSFGSSLHMPTNVGANPSFEDRYPTPQVRVASFRPEVQARHLATFSLQ